MRGFCCHAAEQRFAARHFVGEFLVAGPSKHSDEVGFWAGFLAAHRKDYEDTLGANLILREALDRAGVFVVKLTMWGAARYCSFCGVSLVDYYGPDGGALRDDDFLARLDGQPN